MASSSADNIAHLFQEAMHSRTKKNKLINKYCREDNGTKESSDNLKTLVCLGLRRIIEHGGKLPHETKDIAIRLESKLVQRWDYWEPTIRRNSAKIIIKQARLLSQKRSNSDEVGRELSQYFLKVCNEASQEVVGIAEHVDKIMELFSSKRVVGVCGMAGVGKTPLLQALAKKIKHKEALHAVVHLPLKRKTMEEQQSILFQLSQHVPNFRVSLPKDLEDGRRRLEEILQLLQRAKKHVCFILDGVPTTDFWKELFPHKLQELLGPSSIFIVSSRDQRVIEALSAICCRNVQKESWGAPTIKRGTVDPVWTDTGGQSGTLYDSEFARLEGSRASSNEVRGLSQVRLLSCGLKILVGMANKFRKKSNWIGSDKSSGGCCGLGSFFPAQEVDEPVNFRLVRFACLALKEGFMQALVVQGSFPMAGE
ncbi:hypothetical protein L7F22_021309 [Adiantum nelumboides]|nr:hypothetical protein [Adiantum nelumboides]